jgi:hypothetical protein
MSDSDAPLLLPPHMLDDIDIAELTGFAPDVGAATPLKTEVLQTSVKPKRTTRVVLSPETRRRRRLDREKNRMQGVKHRIEQLRREVDALVVTRDETTQRVEQWHSDHTLCLRTYVPLVESGDQLHRLQQHQDDVLLHHHAQATALSLLAARGGPFRIAEEVDTSENAGQILMDPVALLESMLQEEPLSPREADAFVADSCREMAQSLAQPDWMYGFQEFGGGLSGGRRVTGTVLEFRLAKRLANVTPQVLMEKTWTLLTRLDGYRRIQPQTRQLRVLQRVTDSSWVVGIAVGACHSLVLVGHTAVGNGFIVTFRSLPLVRRDSASESARKRFVESETGSIYSTTFSWYHFQPLANAAGDPVDCDVIFGGTARSLIPEYLNQLQLEVVAGFARWQAAVGYPHVLFLAPLAST